MQFEDSPVFTAFCLEAVAICLFVSFQLLGLGAGVNLLCFNVLFISLTFILRIPLNRKLSMLALGNVVGVVCNVSFGLFYNAGCVIFGDAFSIFYLILYPFFNFMWIVTFWSLSLATLSGRANGS